MTDRPFTPPAADAARRDVYFDDRADRFERNVYGSRKGSLRLALLWADMQRHIPPLTANVSLNALDAGGGLGQMSAHLATAGHRVLLCEPSTPMLAKAKALLVDHPQASHITCASHALQTIPTNHPFDLVICHAVLEWLADPETALTHLMALTQPGGYLSLAFYNRESIVWKNLIKGNFRKVQRGELAGDAGSLTPPNPLAATDVLAWLQQYPATVLGVTGIRCLSDYLWPSAQVSEEGLLAMEQDLGQRDPYRWLGRYIHVTLRRQ